MKLLKSILVYPSQVVMTFQLLADNKQIPQELALSLQKMVGFRNIAVHNYQELDQAVLFLLLKRIQ